MPKTTIATHAEEEGDGRVAAGLGVGELRSADSPSADAVCGGASSPEAILAWTSGSSSRSFHIRLTTSEVTMMPMTHAGNVIARIWPSPRSYGATSVRVSIAAMAAETGEAASAMPDCTTVVVSGRDGRMSFL